MKTNLYKKSLAIVLSTTMVLGSSLTAFATDPASGATGTGTSTGHLDTNIVTADLPLKSTVDNIFDFTIDPERLIDKAGTLADGTTAVAKNNDGVYFLTGKDDQDKPTYGSTSQEVPIKVKNYVAADVSVKATVEGGDKVTLASSADEVVDTADGPVMFLNLSVGSETGAIVKGGVTVTQPVAAQTDNYNVVGKGSKYELEEKAEKSDTNTDGVEWTQVKIKMSGKINKKTVDDASAPTVALTWTVKEHVDDVAPSIATTSYTLTEDEALEVSVNLGGGTKIATDVSSAKWGDMELLTEADANVPGEMLAKYENGKITFAVTAVNFWRSLSDENQKVVVVFDDADNTTVELTLSK